MAFTSQLKNNKPSEISAVTGLAFSLSVSSCVNCVLGKPASGAEGAQSTGLGESERGCDADRQ